MKRRGRTSFPVIKKEFARILKTKMAIPVFLILKQRGISLSVLKEWARRALEHQTDNGTKKMSQQVCAWHTHAVCVLLCVGNYDATAESREVCEGALFSHSAKT